MKQYGERKFWEQGDSVIQGAYPGCPAIVVEVIEHKYDGTFYKLQIDTTGHPEAYDENGDPENVKFCKYSEDLMLSFGN